MPKRIYSASLMILLCLSATFAIAANEMKCAPQTEAKAIAILQTKFRSHATYSWTKEQCFLFITEACVGRIAEIAVRENHTTECGGDPSTVPITDRYRVHTQSKKIERYSAAEGEYVNFTKVPSIEHR